MEFVISSHSMKKMILILAVTLNSMIGLSQELKVTKWEVYEIEFQSKSQQKTPFEETLTGLFTHESGFQMEVPGFYNGKKDWLIRFCPTKEGAWSYRINSSLKGINAQTGQIQVGPAKSGNRGPVQIVQEDPSKFQYADGTPYFLIAFELDWLFALDAEEEKDIPKTRQMIRHVKENGFNQVIMNVYAYDANWGEKGKVDPSFNFAKPRVFPFGGTNENPDHSTLNISFFQRLDRVVQYLQEQEIISHLMIYVWNKHVNWPEPGSAEDNRFFDYVVKRYQAYPNLVWDISKEALAYGRDDMGYITERIERLKEQDAHNRLVTVHDYNYCRTYPDKVDFISVQEWRPNLYDEMRRIAERHGHQPVLNIEHGGYEKSTHSIFDGAYNDPVVCLDRSYQCVFAGVYTTYYWQNTSWYNVIYDPTSLPKNVQPRFEYYKHLLKLFETYDFNTLKPLQRAFNPYFLTNNDGLYLFYIPAHSLGAFGDVKEIKGKKVNTKWFDPLTGNFLPGSSRNMGDGVWLGFEKPDELKSTMAVLVLEVE